MFRTLLSVVGLAMVTVPRRIVRLAEPLAFENPDAAVLREWTIPLARLEGVAYLLVGRRAGLPSGLVGLAIGLIGAVAAVAPRRYLDFGLSLAYENGDELAVRPWVLPATRAFGLLAALSALRALRGRGAD